MSDAPRPLDFASIKPIERSEEMVASPRAGGSFRVVEPDLAGVLRVQAAYRELSTEDDGEDIVRDPGAMAGPMSTVIAECVLDGNGIRVFPTGDDVRKALDWRTQVALFEAAKRVCLLAPDAEVKRAMGESEGGPTSD